jgi:hypothetical protein
MSWPSPLRLKYSQPRHLPMLATVLHEGPRNRRERRSLHSFVLSRDPVLATISESPASALSCNRNQTPSSDNVAPYYFELLCEIRAVTAYATPNSLLMIRSSARENLTNENGFRHTIVSAITQLLNIFHVLKSAASAVACWGRHTLLLRQSRCHS